MFAAAAVAHLDGRFAWAGPAEVAERIEHITASAVALVVEKGVRV